MKNNVATNIRVFANEFISTIMEGNDQMSSGYEWQILYCCEYDLINQLVINTLLALYDGDGEKIGDIRYEMVRNNKMQYMYEVLCDFGDGIVSDQEEEEFERIVTWMNFCDEGLLDKICAYLHKYTQEQMESGKEDACSWPPIYKEYYSPSKIKSFMEKYAISPYVPIVVEVVDDKGMPSKYLSIKSIGFNDESNELVISLREN